MTEIDKQVVALIIINRGESFANTFWLCKSLSRSFEIFDCIEVINVLIKNELVTYTEKDGFENYKLSTKGKEFLDLHFSTTIQDLKIEYPEKKDTINIYIQIYQANVNLS